MVWSPLARGFLSGKYQRGQKAPPGSRLESWQDSLKAYDTDLHWGIIEVLGKVAKRRNSTHAAVALAWLAVQPEVSTIIVGARTVEQLDENLRALDTKVTGEDMKELDEASRPDWGYPYSFIARMQRW